MAVLAVLACIAVVAAGAALLVRGPVRRDGVAEDAFWWDKGVRVGTPEWVATRSWQEPSGDDVRHVEVHHVGDPGRRYYTYERRVWRRARTVRASGTVIDVTPQRESPPAERRAEAPGAGRER
ncbi:MAG: hypothetical protein FWE35_15035 [Streptosporangiales bacterium]|jgi:chitodextrinase|nr:hypothetical protein [Streptosporangiales bacterium]